MLKKKKKEGGANLDEISADSVDWCERKQLLHSPECFGCFVVYY